MTNIQKAKEAKRIKGELMLSSSPLSAKQLLFVLQKTPKEHIYRRPGKGGGEFEYVTGTYMKKVLNYAFGWMWNFEVKEHGREGKAVWALGRLTIKLSGKGNPEIVKEQFGRADIKQLKTGGDVDFGNDLKAAATDALKKCAAELGIASDVYGRQEFKEIQNIDKGFIPPDSQNAKEVTSTSGTKIKELMGMLKGTTIAEKLADLKKRSGIEIASFNITEKHASIIIAGILNSETK